jgi:ABC-type Na+ efflux pump permease subunit
VTVRRLCLRELSESLRHSWFVVNSGVFVVGGPLRVVFGPLDASVLGYRGYARALAGLMQLALFLVPLMALFPAAAALVGERERGTPDYLLAQPVTRGEVYAGTWTGVASAVGSSLVLGFGVTGGIVAMKGVPPGIVLSLLGLALLLALTFVSLGLWISARSSTRARATSLVLTVWLLLVALGSLGFMGAFVAWGLRPEVLEVWAFVNPVEAFRMAMVAVLDPQMDVLGPVGMELVERLGRLPLIGVSTASLVVWSGLGFVVGRRRFGRPEA